MIIVIIIVVVVAIALGGGWYFSGHILKPEREAREAREAAAKKPLTKQGDIWQGFAEAHENNPAVFEENDSWIIKG